MSSMRGPRLQVGSAAWIAEERSSALQIAQSEVEEFSYSVRNEVDWLNEHMAGIFNENEVNIAETFKTPGKLRGKTPRTARKAYPTEGRAPLSDVFSSTPNGSTNPLVHQASRIKSPQPLAPRAPLNVAEPGPTRSNIFSPKPTAPGPATQDSGYYGSQDVGAINIHDDTEFENSQHNFDGVAPHTTAVTATTTTTVPVQQSPSRAPAFDSPEKTFQTAREEQTRVLPDTTTKILTPLDGDHAYEQRDGNEQASTRAARTQPQTVNFQSSSLAALTQSEVDADSDAENDEDVPMKPHSDDVPSQSDGSSPIRPMVRKSSLNFASLPAREPLAAGKSIGARVSRTSHLDQHRASYYNRPTGGKSLGNVAKSEDLEDDHPDEMDVDDEYPAQEDPVTESLALNHTKTYTQRLQDQINLLGKSQTSNKGQTKPASHMQPLQNNTTVQLASTPPKPVSPTRKEAVHTTPGAFPEDDDDDWIEPPATTQEAGVQRPTLPKSYSADVMEGIQGKETIGQPEFLLLKQQQQQQQQSNDNASPEKKPASYGHGKSSSVPLVPSVETARAVHKPASVSNLSLYTLSEADDQQSPPKSPSRSFRDSPLKQVKNKLSSILKSSRGLLASSAAISAEGKSMLSPSSSRLALHYNGSSESVPSKHRVESQSSQATGQVVSPTRPVARRTRASGEREKEEKRREKETKHMEEQMSKLDKAREKEREKARVFSKEQQKISAMEKQVSSKDSDKFVSKEIPRPTRSSPRKAKSPEENENTRLARDVEMADAPQPMPPPSASRATGPGQSTWNKDIKRPIKPAKDANAKSKQVPTVIRVNTGSQHSQYHPSAGRPSTASHDNAAPSSSQPQHQLSSKRSKASLQTKTSTQNLKAGLSSASRPKAPNLNAKKKEQEERETQRQRDAKAKTKQAQIAAQEEHRRQEQQRRQEAERQKQKDREQILVQPEPKKTAAQRQAAIEKAKQTRAPPPAVRSQPNGPPDIALAQERLPSAASNRQADAQPPRPPSRMASGIHRPHDDPGRPVNALLSNASKAGTKRTLAPDVGDDTKRPQSRAGPAYQAKDAKRRRTSEHLEDELDMSHPPNIKGPPVRPSGGFKKDLPAKSVFQSGYSNAPHSATRDLFKATVTAQHTGSNKAANPLDMAQISKGAIPFAPNSNPSGPAYKTPARPGPFNGAKSGAKSVQRSSPRFQNGDSIELPEIQTDDEDEDEDEAQGMSVAAWADSPDLRRALMRQETMDPSNIFGPPAALNMEEVFNKSKDRFPKFRVRTSSANWSGSDRLTEEDIRKDLAARDKLRRDGGWSYEMSKDMM